MANFRQLKKNPNHPFWAFIDQLDNAAGNNPQSSATGAAEKDAAKGKEAASSSKEKEATTAAVDRDATPPASQLNQGGPWEYVNEKEARDDDNDGLPSGPPPDFEQATAPQGKKQSDPIPLDETSDSDDDEEDDDDDDRNDADILKDDPMHVDETPEQRAVRRQARRQARRERREARHTRRKERRQANRQAREQAQAQREARREQWRNPQEHRGFPFHGGEPWASWGPHAHRGPHAHGGPHAHFRGGFEGRGGFGGPRAGIFGGMRGGAHFGGPRGAGHHGRHGGPHPPPPPPPPHAGPGAPPAFPFNFNGNTIDLPAIAGWIQNMFIDPRNNNGAAAGARDAPNSSANLSDFTPAVDIFSTVEAYIVHVALPGAKKSDISVDWAADTSSLVISGVIANDTDTADMVRLTNERQLGAFERRVVLGSTDEYVKIWDEAINARLEDGVLYVHVPKIQDEQAGTENVKKVQIL